jgi:hypothetical protein
MIVIGLSPSDDSSKQQVNAITLEHTRIGMIGAEGHQQVIQAIGLCQEASW